MNLFSVFDPVLWSISLGWFILFFVFILVLTSKNMKLSGVLECKIKFNKLMMDNLSGVSMPNEFGLSVYAFCLFFFVYMSNLLGLFSYNFCVTAQPLVTLGLGFVLWLGCFSMGWFMNFKINLAHLTPEGSPLVLAPFLVLIETVSHLIRPFTLSFRLMANMMAGHLIIGLLSTISELGFVSSLMSLFVQSIVLILEIAVSLIQGLVFSILFVLYAIEYY